METMRLASAVLRNEAVQLQLNSDFLVYGMFNDQTDPELARVMRFPSNSLVSMWILVVKHDQTV